MSPITLMTTDFATDDLFKLLALLRRKLQNIPEHHISGLTIADILHQSPRARHIPDLPPDIQLPFFLRNRHLINRDNERPIKYEHKQPLNVTRAIFFYHLSESHQFQRFHDTSRWNLALFTALLTTTAPPARYPEHITPAAQRFMTTYLAAVLERHNSPTVFTAREDFIKRWKAGIWILFEDLKAAQKRFLKKEMARLNKDWETELDRAMLRMGRREYDSRVAPFVGSIIPGRKDQGLSAVRYGNVRDCERSAARSPEVRDGDMESALGDDENELLGALRVPLEEPRWQENAAYEEVGTTPADVSFALARVRDATPADMLYCLMRLFAVEEEKKKKHSRWDLHVRERVGTTPLRLEWSIETSV